MDSNYLLQVDYHEHRTEHSDHRHPYPSSYSSNDPQYWPYPYQPSHYARYPSQCDTQSDPAAPFICDASSLPPDEFAAASTRLGLFDISAMHPVIGSAEPWGTRNEGPWIQLGSPFVVTPLTALTSSSSGAV